MAAQSSSQIPALRDTTESFGASALIPVVDQRVGDDLVSTVNARELHAFLEVGKVFGTWIQDRITQYNFVEKQDFIIFPKIGKNSGAGRPSKEYAITLDMAKELSMVERNERGKQARLYFIACERRAKAATQTVDVGTVLADPVHLRALLLSYTERVLALEATVQKQIPKVAFHDAVADATNSQTIQEVAKVLGTGPKRLFAFLREEGLLLTDGSNLPYQRYLDAGYFRVIEQRYHDKRGESCTYTRTLITGKGLIYLQKRLQGQDAYFMQPQKGGSVNGAPEVPVLF